MQPQWLGDLAADGEDRLRLVIGRMRSGSRTRNPRWQSRDNMGLMTKERDQ
jgi:hypothetical protein